MLGHAAIFGIVHEADEGAAAHIFQLLMATQLPLVAFFAIDRGFAVSLRPTLGRSKRERVPNETRA